MGMEARMRKPYPSDVSDDEWAFVAPYLTLMTETAPPRHHELREFVQWPALRGQDRRTLALDAQRSAALGSGLPAEPALAAGRLLRGHRARPARSVAPGRGSATRADGGDLRRPHAAEHAREWRASRLRRAQEEERLQDARGGGHPGPPAGAAGDARLGAGAPAGAAARRRGPERDRRG